MAGWGRRYRDSHTGSDNGVRYSDTFPGGTTAVLKSLNVTTIANRLLAWQSVYAGLPHPLLRDATFNLFSHLRSSMWHSAGQAPGDGGVAQYRQWESLEFVDWSNPTNGDERHLNYFHVLPGAMKSQLLAQVANAQHEDDGEFF